MEKRKSDPKRDPFDEHPLVRDLVPNHVNYILDRTEPPRDREEMIEYLKSKNLGFGISFS